MWKPQQNTSKLNKTVHEKSTHHDQVSSSQEYENAWIYTIPQINIFYQQNEGIKSEWSIRTLVKMLFPDACIPHWGVWPFSSVSDSIFLLMRTKVWFKCVGLCSPHERPSFSSRPQILVSSSPGCCTWGVNQTRLSSKMKINFQNVKKNMITSKSAEKSSDKIQHPRAGPVV